MQRSRFIILSYQLTTGLLEMVLGSLMVSAPESYLKPILQFPVSSSPFVSLGGMFIFSLGLCGVLGAYMELRRECRQNLKTVWLVVAIMHSGPAILIGTQVGIGSMPNSWLLIASFCGVLALMPVLLMKLSSSTCWKLADRSSISATTSMKPLDDHKRWIH